MSVIRINLNSRPMDGQSVTFKAPCDCTAVTGIRVYYPNGEEKNTMDFTMNDAHDNNLSGLGNIFKKGAYVHLILSVEKLVAYVQNADTNGYLEGVIPKKASDLGAVPTTREVNNKPLSGNITLSATDVGAVPTSRTVNGKSLAANITLSATDVNAYGTHNITAGTSELTSGSSALTTGYIYQQYE